MAVVRFSFAEGNLVLDNSTMSANVTGSGPITNVTEAIGSGIDIQLSQNAVIQNGGVLETNILGNVTPGLHVQRRAAKG